eukprot:1336740-Amphidinium_carterae.1
MSHVTLGHIDQKILPIWCAMVTLSLSPKDLSFNCQDAREALKKELDGLVKQGIKHWEDEALRTFK